MRQLLAYVYLGPHSFIWSGRNCKWPEIWYLPKTVKHIENPTPLSGLKRALLGYDPGQYYLLFPHSHWIHSRRTYVFLPILATASWYRYHSMHKYIRFTAQEVDPLRIVIPDGSAKKILSEMTGWKLRHRTYNVHAWSKEKLPETFRLSNSPIPQCRAHHIHLQAIFERFPQQHFAVNT